MMYRPVRETRNCDKAGKAGEYNTLRPYFPDLKETFPVVPVQFTISFLVLPTKIDERQLKRECFGRIGFHLSI
jgi:hypothetical protein